MIKGKKITLRLLEQGDLDEYYKLNSDFSEIGEFYPLHLYSAQQISEGFNKGGYWGDDSGVFLMINSEGEIVGEIGYFKGVRYLPGFEIGYRLFKKKFSGKGYMTEALRLFCAYMFANKQINRLEIKAIKGNTGSRIVAEKCGFKYEGVMRGAAFQCGEYKDLESFALLREDMPDLREILGK